MDPHKIGSSSVLTSIPECAITSDDQNAATSMICPVLDKAKAADVSVTFGRPDSSKGKSKGKSEDPNDDPVQAHAAGTSGIPIGPLAFTPQEVKVKALQNCHQARLAFKRGKREHENKVQSKLAKKYKSGELEEELKKAETAYTRGMWGSSKHAGITALLKPPENPYLKPPEKSYLYLLDD